MNKKTLHFLLLTAPLAGSFMPTQAGQKFNSAPIKKKPSQTKDPRLPKEKKPIN